LRSQRQSRLFTQAVQRLLVTSYDSLAAAARFRDLGLRREWIDWIVRGRRLIGNKPGQQLAALQQAMRKPAFLDQAFLDFQRRHEADPSAPQADQDAFVAACLLACGDERQRWHAARWIHNEPLPPAVWEPFHLHRPCIGLEKVLNTLFTVNRLLNQVFCLAFDQMEDTWHALQPTGELDAELRQMALVLRPIISMPRFCLLFMFQTSVWSSFRERADPGLSDRMVAGYGGQELRALTDDAAREIVGRRMQQAVWRELGSDHPPDGEP
jgi:hypothetical protein